MIAIRRGAPLGVQIIDYGQTMVDVCHAHPVPAPARQGADPAADPALLADIDRPLTERGRRDAADLAEHLRLSGCRPQLVLCSPALRTRQTLDLVAPGLGLQARVQVDERIYGPARSRCGSGCASCPTTSTRP